jgi:hypothetical protein
MTHYMSADSLVPRHFKDCPLDFFTLSYRKAKICPIPNPIQKNSLNDKLELVNLYKKTMLNGHVVYPYLLDVVDLVDFAGLDDFAGFVCSSSNILSRPDP